MLVVMINGAPKSGKSHLMRELSKELFHERQLVVESTRHIQLLREMLFAFVARVSPGEYYDPESEHDYMMLKDRMIHGVVGRAWQIAWGTAMRKMNKSIFSLDLESRIELSTADVVLVDDLGFPDESVFADVHYGKASVITIYTESYLQLPTPYADGMQFDGDSRFCLRGSASLIDPTPADAAIYIARRFQENSRQR